MNSFHRQLSVLLAGGLMLALIGCGTSVDPGSIAQNYETRHSVECTIQYSVTFDANIGGVEFDGLQQNFIADAEVDLANGECYLLGTMATEVNGDLSGTIEVEAYGVSGDSDASSYYRYGQVYSADKQENAFLTIINAPISLNLSGGYKKANYAEILYGSSCDVYTGTEIAGDTGQAFVSALAEGAFSLEGCIIDVTLWVYQDTSLPASLALEYSNIDELDISFSDEAGNSYTITDLSYEVAYSGYDSEVSIEVPADFRQAALNGEGGGSGIISDLLNTSDVGSDSLLDGGGLTDDGSGDSGGDTYFICNSDGTCFYEISAPEYMILEEASADSVSFYYCYDEFDIEYIEYALYEDYTSQDEADYAESLADFYRLTDGVSNVSSSGVQSVTVNNYEVQYTILYLTLDNNGDSYDVIDIYSWVAAPNGQDCLEVDISEYNGTGDGLFIDPESELEYAYNSVLEYSEG